MFVLPEKSTVLRPLLSELRARRVSQHLCVPCRRRGAGGVQGDPPCALGWGVPSCAVVPGVPSSGARVPVLQVSPMALGARGASRSWGAPQGGELRPDDAAPRSPASRPAAARSATPGGHGLGGGCSHLPRVCHPALRGLHPRPGGLSCAFSPGIGSVRAVSAYVSFVFSSRSLLLLEGWQARPRPSPLWRPLCHRGPVWGPRPALGPPPEGAEGAKLCDPALLFLPKL